MDEVHGGHCTLASIHCKEMPYKGGVLAQIPSSDRAPGSFQGNSLLASPLSLVARRTNQRKKKMRKSYKTKTCACSLDICRGVTALQLDNMALQAAAV